MTPSSDGPDGLLDGLLAMAREQAPYLRSPERPELRRPPLDDAAIFRVRIDLDHAKPPIWRRLDLRCDLRLDVVHQILQVAFDWTNSHLHRFALGGHPFDPVSQLFLCPYDAEEGDDDGVPDAEVRLDETMQVAGDRLQYIYDYGDSWELTLLLEEVRPAAADSPSAVAIDGRRASPPEDSGGRVDVAGLAEVVDDPAHFEVEDLNNALNSSSLALLDLGLDPRLVELVDQLRNKSSAAGFGRRVSSLAADESHPDSAALRSSLAGYRWFLDHAADGGIELTSAGYLKPAHVKRAAAVVPAMRFWPGTNNREIHAIPLLEFRVSLQSMGLLRKYKGRLLLTRAGAAVHKDVHTLFTHLAERLIPAKPEPFEAMATLVLLAFAATSSGEDLPFEQVAEVLNDLGWRLGLGSPVDGFVVQQLPALDALRNVGEPAARFRDIDRVSPVAAALARAALTRGNAGR